MSRPSKKSSTLPGMRPIFGEADSGKTESKKTAWLLTNRNNLVEILSSGFLKPAHFAARHYADLSSFCVGYLPLLLTHPSAELVEQVRLEGEFNYPVLIRISLDGLHGPIIMLRGEQSELADVEDVIWSGDALLVQGILPIQRIDRILFASNDEQQQVLQTGYGNVPTELLSRSTTDAEAFNGTLAAQAIVSFLQSHHLDDKTLDWEKATYAHVEKIAGGLALAASSLGTRPHLSFAAIVQALNLLEGHNLEGETQISLAVAGLLHLDLPDAANRSQNQLLLTKTAELAAGYLHGFSTSDVVNAVYADVVRTLDAGNPMRELRQDTFRVLESELTLAEFEARWPRKQYDVPSALIRFLLRGDKPPVRQQLMDGQAGTADVLSWFLTGLYLGRSRVPVEAYPDSGLLRAIDSSVAGYVNRHSRGLLETPAPHFELVQSFGLETMFRGDVEIARFNHEGSLEQLVKHFQTQPKEDLDGQLAIDFCEIMGWTNCVRTDITGLISDQKDDMAMSVISRGERRITLSFTGFIREVQHHLKPVQFRKCLSDIKPPSKEATEKLDTLARGLRGTDK